MNFRSSVVVLDSVLSFFGDEEEDKALFNEGIIEGPRHIDVAEFQTHIEHVRESIERELKDHAYVHVDPERAPTCFKRNLFGTDVGKAFPKARYDIQEAGKCFAVGANTAAVFHLMRVAEFGLRALAYDRRVKLPKKATLDLATWEDIIRQLETAEVAIHGFPKTLAREAQYEFYHGAMMEYRSFKNVWRNRFTQTRGDFAGENGGDRARKAMAHVGEFMKILASTITESKRTPIVWKRA